MVNYKTVATNRKAFYNYEVLERLEAGLALKGTEIKSIRAGQATIRDAYAWPQGGELWLLKAHIAPYRSGSIHNHDPMRPRKLLLHREQIDDLSGSVTQKGLTIVPLRLYIKDHVAKVELGLVRGKRKYDKRRAIIDRDKDREARRAMGRIARGIDK